MTGVTRLAAARARREGTGRPASLPAAVQAYPDGVVLVVPALENDMTPERAYELGTDLLNAARAARERRGT